MNKRTILYKTFLSFTFLLLLHQSLFSSEIYVEGIIKDAKTGESLPYANIQIVNSNWGTASNIDGKFLLVYHSENFSFEVTYIGYASKVIRIERTTRNLIVELNPTPIEGKMVVVYGEIYTWVEKFILNAIEKKNNFTKKLSHYQAYSYTKTSITSIKPEKKIYILAESVSKIGYVFPDFYQEKMLNYKIPPTIQNLSYEVFKINQKINIHNDKIKIHNFSIISPLSNNPLRYYDFNIIGQSLLGQDTVITIGVHPKFHTKSLLQGNIVFNKKTYQLLEVNFVGNSAVSNGMFDSLKVHQKYALKDSLYNLPTFTKYEFRMNVISIPCFYNQESNYINYIINDPENKPNAFLDNEFILEPDLTYNVDFQRNNKFKIPLSEKEKAYQEEQESIPPIFSILPNLFLLPLDFPTSIDNIKINKLSNWYHFNKVEGHFIGLEYQFFNTDNLNLYAQTGYAFSEKLVNYQINTRYKHFFVGLERQVNNLGDFEYNKGLQTLDAIFSHKDAFNYYSSHSIYTTFTKNLNSKLNFISKLSFEKQVPLQNNSNWSIKKKGKSYPINYEIQEYNKNYFGITLNYIENHDYNKGKPVIYKGDAFLNLSLDYIICDKELLKSTENRSIFNFDIHRFQPIYNSLSINLLLKFHLQNGTKYIQELNFINKEHKFIMYENSLSFFTLNHYEYIIQDYLRIKSDVNFFNLPRIYYFRLSIGSLLSYLRPLNQIETQYFESLKNDFWEYGISIKGISFFDLYILKNNIKPDKLYIGFKLSF